MLSQYALTISLTNTVHMPCRQDECQLLQGSIPDAQGPDAGVPQCPVALHRIPDEGLLPAITGLAHYILVSGCVSAYYSLHTSGYTIPDNVSSEVDLWNQRHAQRGNHPACRWYSAITISDLRMPAIRPLVYPEHRRCGDSSISWRNAAGNTFHCVTSLNGADAAWMTTATSTA